MARIFSDELATARSVEPAYADGLQDDYPVYTIKVEGNYYMDEFMDQNGVESTLDLVDFLTSQMSKGYYEPSTDSKNLGPGCSSFTGQTADGSRILARNYDMPSRPGLAIIFTNPDDGRNKSVITCDMEHIGIQGGLDSFFDKFLAQAGTYVGMDGMNDKGLAMAIHMSNQGPGHESIPTDLDQGGPDLTSTSMLRLILDRAGTIEEAVEIAKEADLHDDINSSFQYIVADASGRSAILQWVGGSDSEDTDPQARELEVIYSHEIGNILWT